MSTWLPISFRLIKFPLGFPSLVDLGCFLIVSGHKSEKPQAESCSDGTKANPNLCFVWNFYQNGLVLFTLACYQGKYWVIRWNLLQPSVKDYWTRLVVWLVKYYVDIVRKVFALVRNCTNFVIAYWNARIIRLSAFTLKVLRKVLMRKEEKYYSVSSHQSLVSLLQRTGGRQHYHTPKMLRALICFWRGT